MKKGLIILTAVLSLACSQTTIPVTSQEYGPAWPLTIDGGRLQCQTDGPRKLVTLSTSKGIDYALNGSAKSFGFPPADSVLKPGKFGADLQPLIARGLTLCP